MNQNLTFLIKIAVFAMSLLSATGALADIIPVAECAMPSETKSTGTACNSLCDAGAQTSCIPTTLQDKTSSQTNFYYLCPATGTNDPKLTTLATAITALGQINAAFNHPLGSPQLSANTKAVIDAINQASSDFPLIGAADMCQKATLDSLVTALVTALDNKQVTSLDTSCVQATQNLLGNIKICLCPSQEKNAAGKAPMRIQSIKMCFKGKVNGSRD